MLSRAHDSQRFVERTIFLLERLQIFRKWFPRCSTTLHPDMVCSSNTRDRLNSHRRFYCTRVVTVIGKKAEASIWRCAEDWQALHARLRYDVQERTEISFLELD